MEHHKFVKLVTIEHQWHIYLFGSVGVGPSYEYSKPQGTTWTAMRDTTTGFTLTGANLGNTWLDWVRG